MSHLFVALGVAIAVIAVAAPIVAIFLVSVASRREESGHTLSGRAPGPITRTARRLLAYRTQTGSSPSWIAPQDLRVRPRPAAPRGRTIRSGDQPASPTVGPLTISLVSDAARDPREPAGTRAA